MQYSILKYSISSLLYKTLIQNFELYFEHFFCLCEYCVYVLHIVWNNIKFH